MILDPLHSRLGEPDRIAAIFSKPDASIDDVSTAIAELREMNKPEHLALAFAKTRNQMVHRLVFEALVSIGEPRIIAENAFMHTSEAIKHGAANYAIPFAIGKALELGKIKPSDIDGILNRIYGDEWREKARASIVTRMEKYPPKVREMLASEKELPFTKRPEKQPVFPKPRKQRA